MVCDEGSSTAAGSKTMLADDVVISGISGRFPECDTIAEFQRKLFSGVNLVRENDSRWPKGYLDTYSTMGLMKDLRDFDAPFFGAHPKLAERTDPIVRTLLETSFEAVLDAGICPTALRGTETGVVVVVSSNEAADWWSADPDRVNGYEFLGCTRTMYSNRISFSMDLKGPSYTMDSQSSSGLLGIQQAYHMLKCGMVDAVIVAGVNLVLNPHFNVMFKKLNMLSPDGKCKTFDAAADGYARSEAAVAVLVQRASDARRIYGYVAAVHANCDGYKADGCNAVSSASSQIQLYRDTYRRFRLDPLLVSFVEAHGYSTVQGDAEELNAIANVFCSSGRRGGEPLLIGSVKSNVGCSEPVGGLVSLIKTLLAMENGILPPNLHFKTPNPNVAALKDGRLRVVDRLTVWNGKYAAINSFGIGGTNVHLVLRRHEKEKTFDDCGRNAVDDHHHDHADVLPRLVAVSGRTEQAVRSLLDQIQNVHSDDEFCALINNVFSQHIQHYNYRAFSIFGDDEIITEVSTYIPAATQEEVRRPICFVFSGMGSQWAGMCRDLLRTAIFRQTLDRCARVLRSVDFDLYAMLASDDSDVYSNVLNSFVGITCVQIALVNILRVLNIEPDLIIGHSIGELGCAYADDTLSLEQTVLATYWRGKSLLSSRRIQAGAMAAIGLPYENVRRRLPADVTVACHNSVDNVTISGPLQSVHSFVKRLQSEGIFARLVNSSGYAFHSQYIAEAAALFKTQLDKIINDAKRRSERWISTSVPESMWNTSSAQYSSVAYHVNNLLSPVYFSAALTRIPDNAVVVEIAPHSLLQSILKASVGSKCTHIGLLRRNRATVYDLLSNIGRLYTAGLQPTFDNLYQSSRLVSFPVSRKTPMIQSMIEWDHSTKWFLVSFLTKPACVHGEIQVDVDISKSEYKYLASCVYDGNASFPVAAYLCLIWEAVSKLRYCRAYEVPLVVENFQVIRRCVLHEKKPLKFVVNVLERNGDCEIRENGDVVARAVVKIPADVRREFIASKEAIGTRATANDDCYLPLKPNDIYEDLYAKGYSYTGEFKRLLYVDNKGENGKIARSRNWTTYLEAMLQLHLLTIEKQRHYAVDHIRRIVLDPNEHEAAMEQAPSLQSGVAVKHWPNVNVIRSGGIEFSGVKSTLVSARTKCREPIVLRSSFVSHLSTKIFTPCEAVSLCAQLVLENIDDAGKAADVAEIIDNGGSSLTSALLSQTAQLESYILPSITLYDARSKKDTSDRVDAAIENVVAIVPVADRDSLTRALRDCGQRYELIIASYPLDGNEYFRNLLNAVIEDGGFLLMLAESSAALPNEEQLKRYECSLIAKFQTPVGVYALLRKTRKWKTPMVIAVQNDSYRWMDGVKVALRKYQIDGRNTMLIYHGDDTNGLIGFVKSIRREPFGRGLRCLCTDNSINPYKIVDLTYIEYLRKGLTFNVYLNGEWGSIRNLKIDEPTTVECEHAFFGMREIGNLSSLTYMEARIPFIETNADPSPDHELCHVYYSCVYAHDIKCALGLLPYDDYTNVTKQGSVFGHEYSGRDSKGRRVFGMVGGGALATTVLADKTVMWDVPDHWSLEQASTIPRVYSVAYYALVVRANLQRGETAYINAGVAGLCMACVNVVVGVGARVFIGFRNRDEAEILKKTFPTLAQECFVDLEESTVDAQLMERTDHRGVDVVFDTLSSHNRNLFVDSLAYNGRLVEFEKNSAFDETAGYAAVEKNITLHKISHNTLWVSDVGLEDRKHVRQLVYDGMKSGVVKPIVVFRVYSENDVCEAFRVTQSGKYVGKILIKIRDEESSRAAVVIPRAKLVKAYPSAFMDPRNSYVVTGAFTDFGMQTVNWLISRGATKIVLSSQYRPVTGYQCSALRRWQNCANIRVTLCNVDASSYIGAEILLEAANKLAPVAGIFHVTHMECDHLFVNCTKNQFELMWKVKVDIAKNLDLASRKICPSLKYFVGFSDIAVICGVGGKTVSAYANSAMETIYQKRKADNYPATIIRKGQIESYRLAEQLNTGDQVGAFPTNNASLFSIMPELLNLPHETLAVYSGDMVTKQPSTSSVGEKLLEEITLVLGTESYHLEAGLKFEDIGMDPVIKSELGNVLTRFGIRYSAEEIGTFSIIDVLSLLENSKI